MVQKIQIKRTETANSPPADGSLQPGELVVEMNTPTRLWTGVPIAIDPSGKKLLIDTSAVAGGGDVYQANVNTFTNINYFMGTDVIIGHSAALDPPARFEVHGIGAEAGAGLTRWSDNTGGPVLYLRKSRGATPGANTPPAVGDVLGDIVFSANNGGGFYNDGTMLRAICTAAPFGPSAGTNLTFWTCATSGAAMTEVMRLWPSGGLDLMPGVSADPGAGGISAIVDCGVW